MYGIEGFLPQAGDSPLCASCAGLLIRIGGRRSRSPRSLRVRVRSLRLAGGAVRGVPLSGEGVSGKDRMFSGRVNGDSRQFTGEARDRFARHIVRDLLDIELLNTHCGARPRFFRDDPVDEVFPDVAAQIPQVTGVFRGHDNLDGDAVFV